MMSALKRFLLFRLLESHNVDYAGYVPMATQTYTMYRLLNGFQPTCMFLLGKINISWSYLNANPGGEVSQNGSPYE